MQKFLANCGKKVVIGVFLLTALLTGAKAQAAETASLRVISTTDLHNQINNENYDAATKNRTKSLARLSTMIKSARAEVTRGTSITVDVGDSVYGYGAEKIMGSAEQPGDALQPIFAAMKKVGYDAITLGNHDFDYGSTFIKNQMIKSGLSNLCVVANVKESMSGTYPWQRTKIITKQVQTSQGRNINLKIGIVGVTKAELSTYYDYNGILQGESILATVRTQSAALKKQGADIVVVLSHCGFGEENAKDEDPEVGYALSKISTVDCVMLGHQHRNYPSDDVSTKPFYELSNIDRANGLTNGKPVVMVADHADGIGIADLQLKISGSTVTVTGASTEVRKCSAVVPEDPEIASVTDTMDSLIKTTYNDIMANVATSAAITGYFGPLEDNYALQLNNEAKIRFGLQFIHSSAGSSYSKYHVIAATRFYLDGSEGKDNYIEIGDNFTRKDILNIQEYQHNNNYVYWITGAQLKRWMEWSASMFAQSNEIITSDSVLAQLMKQTGAASVVSNSWVKGWQSYAIFDGLEYTIDASQPPRYNVYGEELNAKASRIKNLTYNGKAVTNTTKFILVDNYVSKESAVRSALYNQRLTSKDLRTSYYLENYVKELGNFDPITNQADHNWSVSFGTKGKRIVRSSSLSEKYALLQPWYKSTLKMTEDCAYYEADLANGTKETDTYGPLLVLAPSTTKITNKNVTVYIQASDASGVSQISYLQGQHDAEDSAWANAKKVSNNALTITNNSIYSICATDGNGNRTVKHIDINNINTKVLEVPTIDKFSNKKTYVTGEAQAGLTVHISASGKNYTTTVNAKGKYSCKISKQRAGRVISVYVSDKSGRKSSVVKTTVLRRGPNSPTLNAVTNKTKTLTGKVNDTNTTILVYVDDRVYVPKSRGISVYKECDKYSKKKKIYYASKYKVSKGTYHITISVPKAKKTITVFAVDSKGRCSLVTKRSTQDAAPNQPQVNKICDAEKLVTGKIPSATKICKVTVKAGKKKYTAKSKKNGHFVVKTGGFKAGSVISVYASDTKNGKKRTSLSVKCTVGSQNQYISKNSKITVKSISNRSTVVRGKVTSAGDVYINYGTTSAQLDINKGGSFSYSLPEPLAGGTVVYIVRYNKSTGEVVEVKKLIVKMKTPSKPKLATKKITKDTKKIAVLAGEKATVVVKTGKKVIKTTACKYDKKKKRYVYRVAIPKGKDKIVCYVQNTAGKSKVLKVKRKTEK
ncbi:MAG: Ig-like domain-containing protein [Butyribacter sp.]|nr:Ig-like domain-containing protein [Butyribacter sp.]